MLFVFGCQNGCNVLFYLFTNLWLIYLFLNNGLFNPELNSKLMNLMSKRKSNNISFIFFFIVIK